MAINITPKPDVREQRWGKMLYVQAHGPFDPNAKKAWGTFWQEAAKIDRGQCVHMLGLSHMDPSAQGETAFTYRAGVIVKEDYHNPFAALQESQIQGGRYACYLLTGSYDQLGDAFAFALKDVEGSEHVLRNDFCVELYINSPENTPTEALQTELYIPIA